MNTALEALYSRRSIRKYKTEQITDEELVQVLRAGMLAPSAMNRQSAIIVAVQNAEQIAYMSELNRAVNNFKSDPFYGAPTVLVVLAAADSPSAVQDGSLVMGNLMNAAEAVGLGSCWIHRAREVFDTDAGKELLRQWGIEGSYIGIGNCILGYKDENPAPKPRKENYVTVIK